MLLLERPKMPTEYFDMNNCDLEVPHFDNKMFISEVKKRPAIWDTTARIYSDKLQKKKSWDELVDIFINKEDPSVEERNEFHKTLQRKWKSARDCFNRECQRLQKAKQGIATSRKSPYMYYKNLSFLHQIMNKTKSVNGTKSEEPSLNDTSNSTDASSVCNLDTSNNISYTSSGSNTDAADTSTIRLNDIYIIDDAETACNSVRSPKRPRINVEHDDDITRMLQPNIQLIEGKAPITESTYIHQIMNKTKSVNGIKNEEPLNDTSDSTDASSVSNLDTSNSISYTSSGSNTDAADTSAISVNDIYIIDDAETACNSVRSPKRPRINVEHDDDITRMLQPIIQLIEGKAPITECAAKTQDEDSDRLFLLSLHEPLKQVPKHLQMSVRVKLMQVIIGAMKCGKEAQQE